MGQLDPKYQLVYPGSPATIRCMGNVGHMYWEKDGNVLEAENDWWGKDAQMATIRIPIASRYTAGEYHCIGNGSVPFNITSQLYLTGYFLLPG